MPSCPPRMVVRLPLLSPVALRAERRAAAERAVQGVLKVAFCLFLDQLPPRLPPRPSTNLTFTSFLTQTPIMLTKELLHLLDAPSLLAQRCKLWRELPWQPLLEPVYLKQYKTGKLHTRHFKVRDRCVLSNLYLNHKWITPDVIYLLHGTGVPREKISLVSPIKYPAW